MPSRLLQTQQMQLLLLQVRQTIVQCLQARSCRDCSACCLPLIALGKFGMRSKLVHAVLMYNCKTCSNSVQHLYERYASQCMALMTSRRSLASCNLRAAHTTILKLQVNEARLANMSLCTANVLQASANDSASAAYLSMMQMLGDWDLLGSDTADSNPEQLPQSEQIAPAAVDMAQTSDGASASALAASAETFRIRPKLHRWLLQKGMSPCSGVLFVGFAVPVLQDPHKLGQRMLHLQLWRGRLV